MEEPQSKAPARELKQVVLSSLIWKYLETFGSLGIGMVISLIVARLVGPDAVGTLALLVVFTNLINVFIQNGFSMALIQKKNADELDESSVFYVTTALAVVMYVVLYFCAPFIARYYNRSELTMLLRVLALSLLPGGLTSVLNAVVARKFQFKASFIRSVIAISVSGSIGIFMAYRGFGTLSLVIQTVVNVYINGLVTMIAIHWRPRAIFSWARIRSLFSFGGKILASNLLDTFYQEIYSLVIGKQFNVTQLGYYNKGRQFPTQLVIGIDSSIQSVMLPAYASKQDDVGAIKGMVRQTICASSFVVFPLLAGMAAVAKPMITLLLTEAWHGAVPFLQIYCLALLGHPLNIANAQAINALGRSDVTLRVNLLKKAIGFTALFASIPLGIYGVAWSFVVSSTAFLILNVRPNRKLIHYGLLEQLRDCFPALSLSAAMFLVVSLWQLTDLGTAAMLAVQIVTGVAFYTGIAFLLHMKGLIVLLDICKHFAGKLKRPAA